MGKARPILAGLAAALLGAGTVFLVVVIGSLIGGLVETRIGTPVVSYELITVVTWFFATPGGVLVAVAGVFTRRWRRGLAVGLLAQGVYFLVLVFLSQGIPFASGCWMVVVGTIAGGVAGAMGGAIGQIAFKPGSSD